MAQRGSAARLPAVRQPRGQRRPAPPRPEDGGRSGRGTAWLLHVGEFRFIGGRSHRSGPWPGRSRPRGGGARRARRTGGGDRAVQPVGVRGSIRGRTSAVGGRRRDPGHRRSGLRRSQTAGPQRGTQHGCVPRAAGRAPHGVGGDERSCDLFGRGGIPRTRGTRHAATVGRSRSHRVRRHGATEIPESGAAVHAGPGRFIRFGQDPRTAAPDGG